MGGSLFSAEFEKAFDSVKHTFLFATLQSFGFRPQFIHWARTIFQSAESCVIANDHSTRYFPLERGTRQDDPLSAYLFILCLKTLFIQIRENDNIKGIGTGNYKKKNCLLMQTMQISQWLTSIPYNQYSRPVQHFSYTLPLSLTLFQPGFLGFL